MGYQIMIRHGGNYRPATAKETSEVAPLARVIAPEDCAHAYVGRHIKRNPDGTRLRYVWCAICGAAQILEIK